MLAPLTQTELELARKLAGKGVPLPAATLAIVLITREHSRPEQELLHIVRQYQGLEEPRAAAEAVADLKQRGWLEEFQSYGVTLLRQEPNLLKTVADRIHESGVTETLRSLRSVANPYVRTVGNMNEAEVYTSYLELLRGAHSEIRLPMLATSPELGSVPILKERASRGVRVRILLGSVRVVTKLRGATMRDTAIRAISGWMAHAKEQPNIEVRVTDNVNDMLMATCMSIDERLLRFDIYDAKKQRSLQGVMIEVAAPSEIDLNLIALFRRSFDEAWARGYTPTVGGRVAKFLWSSWHWLLFVVFTLVSVAVTSDQLMFAIFTSVAASFFVSALLISIAGVSPGGNK